MTLRKGTVMKKYCKTFSYARIIIFSLMLIIAVVFLPKTVIATNTKEGNETSSSPVEKPTPGKFILTIIEEKVSLYANEADVQEILAAIAKTIGIEFKCERKLNETKSILLTDVSVEQAVRRVADSYLLEFVKTSQDDQPKLTAITAVPSKALSVGTESTPGASTTTLYENPYRGKGVSEELARKAVLNEVQKVYGKAQIAKTFTYYSVDNKQEAYCYILYRKENELPDIDEMLANMAKQKNEFTSLKADLSKVQDSKQKAEIIRKLSKARAELVNSYGREEFVTATGSAHEGHVPVLGMVDGLSLDLALLPEVTQQLSDEYGENNVKFVRTIYAGMFTVMHEFDIGGGKTILVDPRSGQEIDKQLVLDRAATEYKKISEKIQTNESTREALEKRKALMEKKWQYVRNLK